MFSKVFTTLFILLVVSVQINAHAIITPALGVNGTAVRGDVQRPSTASPCGTVDVASSIGTSTAVVADANGTFITNATDFNAGADGSRSVTAKVDPTGKGTTFDTDVKVTQNGNANPTTVGTDQIVASLPSNTTCSGGKDGNICLVQFITSAGFGNCVAVVQGQVSNNVTAAGANTTTSSNATTTTTDAPTTQTKKHCKHKHTKAKAAGTRAARALLADLKAREDESEETLDIAKRVVSSWVWA
jgi:hypothetical protein